MDKAGRGWVGAFRQEPHNRARAHASKPPPPPCSLTLSTTWMMELPALMSAATTLAFSLRFVSTVTALPFFRTTSESVSSQVGTFW